MRPMIMTESKTCAVPTKTAPELWNAALIMVIFFVLTAVTPITIRSIDTRAKNPFTKRGVYFLFVRLEG
jgi:hypothetical protein